MGLWRSSRRAWHARDDTRLSLFEFLPREPALANDGLQRAAFEFVMIGNGNRDRGAPQPLLHDNMAAATPDFLEPMPGQDGAYLAAGENS